VTVVHARELTKHYGNRVVVDHLSFTVEGGEIFGVLGPNGAGKTTTVEMLEGLRTPDGGSVRVLGLDPGRDRRRLAARYGVQLQSTALFGRLTVEETLATFARFYPAPRPIADVLAAVALDAVRDLPVDHLSPGQRQALALGLAILNDPALLFLDEPTVGLDPHARQRLWSIIRDTRDRGATVMLTTHYMEEAEALCDRVMVLHRGAIVALDTTKNLVAQLMRDSLVEFETTLPLLAHELTAVAGVERVISLGGGRGTLAASSSATAIVGLSRLLAQRGGSLRLLAVKAPSLEDAFLSLTARPTA